MDVDHSDDDWLESAPTKDGSAPSAAEKEWERQSSVVVVIPLALEGVLPA
jgi:hypothetical protein